MRNKVTTVSYGDDLEPIDPLELGIPSREELAEALGTDQVA